MQARTAARELTLILFSQFDKNIDDYSPDDFEDIILRSVRTLTNNATEELKLSIGSLIDIKEYLDEFEMNSEDNLNRPIGVKNIPVQIPLTSDMGQMIDNMLSVAEKALAALEIAEITTLEEKIDVKNFTLQLAKKYKDNHVTIDNLIKEYAIGWDFSRLVKMDKDILRLAITEILFIENSAHKVAIDEAIELAKKYSTQDSSSFINGILAKIVEYKKSLKGSSK